MIPVVTDRLDRAAIVAFAMVVLGLTLASQPSLREMSTSLSLVCFVGLLWRFIGSFPRMNGLSVVLAISLGLTLATSFMAQYLLSRQITSMPQALQPDNTIGILLVVSSRLFILVVIVFWSRWLTVSGNRA